MGPLSYHHNLRSQRIADLTAMGFERIRAELERIRQMGWKNETIVQWWFLDEMPREPLRLAVPELATAVH